MSTPRFGRLLPARTLSPAVAVLLGLLPAVLLGLMTAPQPCLANPLPAFGAVWNVHPWQQDFCAANPITQCSQAAQYTTATGVMEFDIFVLSNMGPTTLNDVTVTVSWPSSWSYVLFDCCSAYGDWDEVPGANQRTIHLTYSTAVTFSGPYLVGRLKLNCPGYGNLSSSVQLNGEWAATSPAQAGVGDCYSTVYCYSFMLAPAART
jgi:hypothetical protein